MTSSIGGLGATGSSMAYAVSKAAGEPVGVLLIWSARASFNEEPGEDAGIQSPGECYSSGSPFD